jgi:hypothetical protein
MVDMKKIIFLFLLLFISFKAFAQVPSGYSPMLSMQGFFKIASGDTSWGVKAANGTFFNSGIGSIQFSNNFQYVTGVVDLNNSIHLTDTIFAKNGVFSRNIFATEGFNTGDSTSTTHRAFTTTALVGANTVRGSLSIAQLMGGGASFNSKVGSGNVHVLWLPNLNNPYFSDDAGVHNHKVAVIDTCIGCTIDTTGSVRALTITGGGSDSTLYKRDGTITDPVRTVTIDSSLLAFKAQKGSLQLEVDHEYDYWSSFLTDTASGNSSNLGLTANTGSIFVSNSKHGFRYANIDAEMVCCDVDGIRPISYLALSVKDSTSRIKQIVLVNKSSNIPGQEGIVLDDRRDTIGGMYVDTSVNRLGRKYDRWIPSWGAVKIRIDSVVSAHGGGGGVTSFNTRTGAVVPVAGDYASLTETLTNKDLTSGTNTFPTFNQNTTGSAAKWTTARLLAGNSVDGSANVQFSNKFIVQGTSDAGLTGAQFLGSLSTGIVKNTTTTGVLSIATAGTDYQAPITLTTTGNSGSSSLVSNTLNIPTYTAAGLGAVPTTTTVAGFPLSSNVTLGTLTFGTHLTSGGSSYNGSTGVTITSDATNSSTASTIVARDANANTNVNNLIDGYQTIATASGTTTLTVSSPMNTFFTGILPQTVTLPVVSTLVLGQQFVIVNGTSNTITVNSSGGNIVLSIAGRASGGSNIGVFTCISTSGTTAASWTFNYYPQLDGSGNIQIPSSVTVGLNVNVSGAVSVGSIFNSTNSNLYNPTKDDNTTNQTLSKILFGGASAVNLRTMMGGDTHTALTANANYANVEIASSPVTTGTSGTNAWLVQNEINSFGTINGTAPVTNTAMLKIENAASAGTNNYSIYAGTGTYHLDGLTVSQIVATDANKNLISIPYGSNAFSAKTTTYSATSSDQILTGDATSAAFTITVPTAVGITGKSYTVKKIDSSGNAVTVATTSSQTIDGSTTYSLASQYKYVTLVSNGSNWIITANN